MRGATGATARRRGPVARALRAAGLLPVRWSGLAMAIGFAVAGAWVQAAVAMLVALAQVLGWRLRLPLPWEVALSLTCLVAAVSSYLDLYARISWWDLPVHGALTGQLALLGLALARRRPRPRAVLLVGAVLAVVWEGMERWAHDTVAPTVYDPGGDTLLDVAMGLLGSAAAAWLWGRTRGRGPR